MTMSDAKLFLYMISQLLILLLLTLVESMFFIFRDEKFMIFQNLFVNMKDKLFFEFFRQFYTKTYMKSMKSFQSPGHLEVL
jgi:hypothetical protein